MQEKIKNSVLKCLFLLLAAACLTACGGEKSVMAKAGETVSTALFDFSISDVETINSYSGVEVPDGSKLVRMQLTVKNTSDETYTMFAEDFQLQWGDGDESYALRETQDTLGGGEAGRTAAQTFSAPLGSYDDGSFYGQLTARQKACYDALAAIPLSQILTASENQGYKQVRVGVDEFYGLGMTGYILNQVFTPSASSEPLYRQLYESQTVQKEGDLDEE